MDRLAKFVNQLTEEEREMLKYMISPLSGTPCARAEILYKFPSLNEYIRECRNNKYGGANAKKKIQRDISKFLQSLPVFTKPISIDFTWVEGNNKRDWDNVIYSRKFILDALVTLGKLPDDSWKFVRGFQDERAYEKGVWKVVLTFREIEEG